MQVSEIQNQIRDVDAWKSTKNAILNPRLHCSGFYAIKYTGCENLFLPEKSIKDNQINNKTPIENSNILYFGIASNSFKERFFNQEISGIGHGTFFRTIGLLLRIKPKAHCLRNKKGANFKYSEEGTERIVEWLKSNTEYILIPKCILGKQELQTLETKFLKDNTTRLNIKNNNSPLKLALKQLRRDAIGFSRYE